jgi:O-acetyl-ADP-ribose deacetylase
MIYDTRIDFLKGDITKMDVDVIVNAANNSLLGGGGVDGAIHRAGGPSILEACKAIGGCKTGDAVITTGGNLKAKHVIHTVGPVWKDGKNSENQLLASCYKRSMEIATTNALFTIAFPNISTGVYRFPKHLACEIALDTVNAFLSADCAIEKVLFVCFDDENYAYYHRKLGR